VSEIRGKVPKHCLRHCWGRDNPADLPSRGTSLKDVQKNELWLRGPDWFAPESTMAETVTSVSPECLEELRA
uniref:Uncharacterized protein n=1 Tax=Amphimedon queenslandica TaxID=400682 RepID=A0A1X7TC35_AMPQE